MSGYERPVELDPADAATALRILESARVPLNGPAAEDLLHSIAALRDGLEEAKLPKVPDDLSELLDAGRRVRRCREACPSLLASA